MKRILKNAICMIAVFMTVVATKMITYAAYFDTPYTYLPGKETIAVDEVSTIALGVGSEAESISNIASDNKKLDVKLYYIGSEQKNGGKWYYIQMYSKKKGIFKVRYKYTDSNGAISDRVLKVKVTDEKPIESVKLKGKELSADHANIISGKKGKLVVKMNKGYKLKKIELKKQEFFGKEYGETKYVTTKVKNKSIIKIPDIPFTLITTRKTQYSRFLAADSCLIITYKDKYSKMEKTVTYWINKKLI